MIKETMTKCDRCGKEIKLCRRVMNYYPPYGFPHDTERILCNDCKDKFDKYITRCYEKFFNKKGD